jgi:hypothetical protein
VKKNNLLQGAIVALLVVSPFAVNAGQYPAADFEPKVLYQDESVKSAPASTPVAKAAPVAVATPAPVASSADDSKYPAANFEPKVLFKDDAYKPVKSTPAPASEYKTSASTSAGAVIMEQAAVAEKKGDNSLLLILSALVAAGFAASRCPKFAGIFGGKNASNEPSAPTETGVTRYLNARIPKVSGVTKYLERADKPTNVARYIAKQNIAQKAAQNDANRG